jgi:hypothetical protein
VKRIKTTVVLFASVVLVATACNLSSPATPTANPTGTYQCAPNGGLYTTSTTDPNPGTLSASEEGCWGLHTGVVGFAIANGADWMSGSCSGSARSTQSGCDSNSWAPAHSYTEHVESAEALSGTGCGGPGCSGDPQITLTIPSNAYIESDGIHVGGVLSSTVLTPTSNPNNVVSETSNGTLIIQLVHTYVEGCIGVYSNGPTSSDAAITDDIVKTGSALDGANANTACAGGSLFSTDAGGLFVESSARDSAISSGDGNTAHSTSPGMDASYDTIDGSLGSPPGAEGPGSDFTSDGVQNHGIAGSQFTASQDDIFGFGQAIVPLGGGTSSSQTMIDDNYLHDADYAGFNPFSDEGLPPPFGTCNHASLIFEWSAPFTTIKHNFLHAQTAAGVALANSIGSTEDCDDLASAKGHRTGVGISAALFWNGCQGTCVANTAHDITVTDNYIEGDTGPDNAGPCISSDTNVWTSPIAFTNNALAPGGGTLTQQDGQITSWSGNYNASTGASVAQAGTIC